jgi:hypothetical protein
MNYTACEASDAREGIAARNGAWKCLFNKKARP